MFRLVFFNIGGVDASIEGRGSVVAGRYCKHLNLIGKHALGVVVAGAVLSPDPVFVFCLLSVLAVWVVYKGREYRAHLSEILEIYSGWRILRLLIKAWLFWVAVGVIDALLIGLLDLDQIVGLKVWCVSLLLGAL